MQRLKLFYANVFLIQDPAPILIDTGAPSDAQRILKWLSSLGIAPTDLKLIVVTHAHFDHAGSLQALKAATNAPVAIHRQDADILEKGKIPRLYAMDFEGYLISPFARHEFPPVKADIIIEEGFDFNEFGLDARWLHTPGHSDGSISILLPSGDAIVGDILRGGFLGGNILPHIPHQPYFLHDKAQFPTLLDSIQRVIDAGAQTFHLGHGGPLRRADVEKWLAKRKGV